MRTAQQARAPRAFRAVYMTNSFLDVGLTEVE
jgi:hypothetical protein